MRSLKHFFVLVCCCMATYGYASPAGADTAMCSDNCCCGGSQQTPVGIMTDHVHGKGQWMAAYMYMNMMMQGNRHGATRLSDADIFSTYLMAPEKMTMQMHMAMVMYGITDRLTGMAMLGYVTNHMDMNMNEAVMHMHMGMGSSMGSSMSSSSSGLADSRLYALYSLLKSGNKRLIATLGVNIPTGSVTLNGETMLGSDQRLAYPMQTGSGTWGILPSLTYVKAYNRLSWGANVAANINIGTNSEGYSPGNTYNCSVWGSYRIWSFMSASLRAEGISADRITGYDSKVAVLMNNDPNADSRNYGGQRLNMYLGANFSIPSLPRIHVLAEYGMPVYEYLNGVQMSQRSALIAGAQYTF